MAHILVVDDASLHLDSLCDNLKSSGHVCEPASNVAEALALLNTRHIDLVLTDHDMPTESGLSLIKKMKNQPELEPIPVILMTGIPDPALMAVAKKVGAFAAIPKPLDLDFLFQAVAQALEPLSGNGSHPK